MRKSSIGLEPSGNGSAQAALSQNFQTVEGAMKQEVKVQEVNQERRDAVKRAAWVVPAAAAAVLLSRRPAFAQSGPNDPTDPQDPR